MSTSWTALVHVSPVTLHSHLALWGTTVPSYVVYAAREKMGTLVNPAPAPYTPLPYKTMSGSGAPGRRTVSISVSDFFVTIRHKK